MALQRRLSPRPRLAPPITPFVRIEIAYFFFVFPNKSRLTNHILPVESILLPFREYIAYIQYVATIIAQSVAALKSFLV